MLLSGKVDGKLQQYDLTVRIATTTNVGLSGLSAIDGVTPSADDRILVKNQTTASQNGLYAAASGSWSRTTDANTSSRVRSGQIVYVSEGGQAASLWVLTTANPITLGTTSLSYARASTSNRQTLFTEITADTTTTSTTFVDLLTQSITTTGGDLLINFAAASSNSNNDKIIFFRITVNGTAHRGAATLCHQANKASGSSIIQKITGLTAGTQTVKVQWRVDANTGQIRPVADPDSESASLVVQEIV